LLVFGDANVCSDGLVLGLHYQNVVVELTDFQSHIVLDSACLFTTHLQIRARYVISCSDFEQFGERLCQARTTCYKVLIALIYVELLWRNRTASYDSKCGGGNADELCISEMPKRTFILNSWQVRASRHLLGVLLLFDMKSRDTHGVIVPQRRLHGFMKIDGAWSCWGGLLSKG
jgi:hypothetical protein